MPGMQLEQSAARRARPGLLSPPLPPACCAADSDVAFANKPVWDSYLAFIDEVGADGAFQAEHSVGAPTNADLLLGAALPLPQGAWLDAMRMLCDSRRCCPTACRCSEHRQGVDLLVWESWLARHRAVGCCRYAVAWAQQGQRSVWSHLTD